MNRPWNSDMQLGIVHFMLYPELIKGEGPIMETARVIAEDDFFEVIEVGPIKDQKVWAELKGLIEGAHMSVGVGAQPGLLINKLNLAAEEEKARQAAVDNVRGSIDQAYFLGARVLALLDGPGSYPGKERKAAAIDQLVRSLSELCAYAEERATDYLLTISLENFDQNVDKRSLIGPTKDAAEVASRVREEHTNFGLTVDLSHLPLLDETPQEALAAAKDYLVHIHVGNCLMKDVSHPLYGDNHPPLGIEGGENDVQELVEFLEALFDIRYFTNELPTGRPVVTFEVKPLPDQDPAVVIAATKRVWKEAWARLEVE